MRRSSRHVRSPNLPQPAYERRTVIWYAILTSVICAPLLWSFLLVRSVYPITTWSMMTVGGDLTRGRAYSILRGESIAGETINIPPVTLTNALYSRTWGLVNATVANASFKFKSIHPENAALMSRLGGLDNLPAGTRVPDLLQAWGQLYNQQQPSSSPHRLKAIRLDMYRWEGGGYEYYDTFIQSWRKEL